MTVPFITMKAISDHGNQIAKKVLEHASGSDEFSGASNESANLAMAISLIRKAVTALVMIDDIKYGKIGFQVVKTMPLPEPSPEPGDTLKWLEAMLTDDDRPMDLPKPRKVLSEVSSYPNSAMQKASDALVEKSITDEWLVLSVLELAIGEKEINDSWFDSGLTFMGCIQASMLMLTNTFDDKTVRNVVSYQLKKEVERRTASYHTMDPGRHS